MYWALVPDKASAVNLESLYTIHPIYDGEETQESYGHFCVIVVDTLRECFAVYDSIPNYSNTQKLAAERIALLKELRPELMQYSTCNYGEPAQHDGVSCGRHIILFVAAYVHKAQKTYRDIGRRLVEENISMDHIGTIISCWLLSKLNCEILTASNRDQFEFLVVKNPHPTLLMRLQDVQIARRDNVSLCTDFVDDNFRSRMKNLFRLWKESGRAYFVTQMDCDEFNVGKLDFGELMSNIGVFKKQSRNFILIMTYRDRAHAFVCMYDYDNIGKDNTIALITSFDDVDDNFNRLIEAICQSMTDIYACGQWKWEKCASGLRHDEVIFHVAALNFGFGFYNGVISDDYSDVLGVL